MARIIWTLPALDDQRAIVEHIALDSPGAAKRMGIALLEAPDRLKTFPRSGRIVPEVGEDSVRELIVGPYRLIYTLNADICHITAILHGSRDIARRFALTDEP